MVASKKSGGSPAKSKSKEVQALFAALAKKFAANRPTLEVDLMDANQHANQHADNCRTMLNSREISAKCRAEYLIIYASEVGLDLLPSLAEIIEKSDRVAVIASEMEEVMARVEQAEKEKRRPLQPEVYVRSIIGEGGPSALLLTQAGLMIAPCDVDLEGLACGDFVLVDPGSGSIVARDGAIVPTGEIVKIDSVPDNGAEHVVVRIRDERLTAMVSERLRSSADLKPGAEVVFDPQRRFIYRILDSEVDGSDLLTPASELYEFGLEALGAPHPVLRSILDELKRDIEHPEWSRRMRSRQRRSYLFYGPTGTGKTFTIMILVNLIANWIESLTGHREPRVIFSDASDFFSPYFGESETKIINWFRKLGQIAKKEVATKDGRQIRLPIVVVIEELEGLIRARGERNSSSHLFDRVVSLLLKEMDSASNNLDAPIVFISTTNMKSLLDAAGKRRFGAREVKFGNLDAQGALSVLRKKVPEDMPIACVKGESQEDAREKLIRKALYSLFGDTEGQLLAEVELRDSSRVYIRRRDLVTGARIEMATGQAVDRVLGRSTGEGELLGLDALTLVEALDEQFESIASGLTCWNVVDSAPDLFGGTESADVANVNPVNRPGGHPPSYFSV